MSETKRVRIRHRRKPKCDKKVKISEFIYKLLLQGNCADLYWIDQKEGYFGLKLSHGNRSDNKAVDWKVLSQTESDHLYYRWCSYKSKLMDKKRKLRSRKDLKHATKNAISSSRDIIRSIRKATVIQYKFREDFYNEIKQAHTESEAKKTPVKWFKTGKEVAPPVRAASK